MFSCLVVSSHTPHQHIARHHSCLQFLGGRCTQLEHTVAYHSHRFLHTLTIFLKASITLWFINISQILTLKLCCHFGNFVFGKIKSILTTHVLANITRDDVLVLIYRTLEWVPHPLYIDICEEATLWYHPSYNMISWCLEYCIILFSIKPHNLYIYQLSMQHRQWLHTLLPRIRKKMGNLFNILWTCLNIYFINSNSYSCILDQLITNFFEDIFISFWIMCSCSEKVLKKDALFHWWNTVTANLYLKQSINKRT